MLHFNYNITSRESFRAFLIIISSRHLHKDFKNCIALSFNWYRNSVGPIIKLKIQPTGLLLLPMLSPFKNLLNILRYKSFICFRLDYTTSKLDLFNGCFILTRLLHPLKKYTVKSEFSQTCATSLARRCSLLKPQSEVIFYCMDSVASLLSIYNYMPAPQSRHLSCEKPTGY